MSLQRLRQLRPARIGRYLSILALIGTTNLVITGKSLAADPGYHVSGNTIRDSSNNIFTPHGVDISNTEWSCTGHDATDQGSGIPASEFTTMKTKWGANIVRLPLNEGMWLPGSGNYCSTYKANMEAIVAEARAAGLVVDIDLHWSDGGNLSAGAHGQECMADNDSKTFWNQVATIYKGDSGVWFEMYNEPHVDNWSIWENGGSDCGFTTVGMQTLYATIRATGATNIVLAGGNGYAAHLDGVPLLSGTNIVYAIHPYANNGSPNSWSDNDWTNRFGYLVAKAPVMATEFGAFTCSSTTYNQAILDFMRLNGVGYSAWAWYNGGCSYPSLITDDAGDCVSTGCFVQKDMLGFVAGTEKMVYPTYTGAATPTTVPTATATPVSSKVIGDVNGDGKVNALDLSTLISHWQSNYTAADFNKDGVVNILDLSTLLDHWTG